MCVCVCVCVCHTATVLHILSVVVMMQVYCTGLLFKRRGREEQPTVRGGGRGGGEGEGSGRGGGRGRKERG